MATAAPSPQQQGPPSGQPGVQPSMVLPSTWPLFDLFMDLPHPEASTVCQPPLLVESPQRDEVVWKELVEDPNSLGRIIRFAFPEHDDKQRKLPPSDLNRHDVYYTKGFQHHLFSLQLSNGQRVQGHVRRYLPTHTRAPFRYDVGRRGVRALVILTRANGGDTMFACMLKTLDALTALKNSAPQFSREEPQKYFLHLCYSQHISMVRAYNERREEDRKPMILNVEGLEYGGGDRLRSVDTNLFLMATNLLRHQVLTMAAPILPLLRCLGVPNALRLLSALLSERRCVLVSRSPTRLATCCRSALSILAQGLLSWQHLLIPVLPPHLIQYLQAPFPYLIGILSTLYPTFQALPDVGEILLINLDTNELEARGIPANLIASRIPDLFRSGLRDEIPGLNTPNLPEVSASECLDQDLVALLKSDKKTLFGESTLSNITESTAKVARAVKSAFGKFRERGRQLLQNQDSSSSVDASEQQSGNTGNAVTDDEIYTEGCQNEMGEEEARVAFCNFFLCVYGDMRWYLSPPQHPGETPRLDRDRFLKQKAAWREGPGTPMYPLLQNLCQSQMFEQFVKARVDEINRRVPVTKDSPLFSVCAYYHRTHNIDYSVANVRRVTRQVSQANPSRLISQANANARRMAMALTSNKAYEGNHMQAMAQLVEYCHETSVLMDVMSVVWMRLRDCKGGQWKHAALALQILRNLLYHGPLAAIPEAIDGIDKIKALKKYRDNMRVQICQQIQQTAGEVYTLLADRALIFVIRRVCANRRCELRNNSKPKLQRDRNLRFGVPFKSLHPYMHPSNRRQVVPQPAPQPTAQFAQPPTSPPRQQQQQQQQQQAVPNAFAVSPQPPIPQQSASTVPNPFVSSPPPPQERPPPQQQQPVYNDLLGLMDSDPAQSTPTTGIEASMAKASIAGPFDPFGSTPAQPAPAITSPQAKPFQAQPGQSPTTAQPYPPAGQRPSQSYGQQHSQYQQYNKAPTFAQLPPQRQAAPAYSPTIAQLQPAQPGAAPPQYSPHAGQPRPGYPQQQQQQQQYSNPFLSAPQPQQQRPTYSQFDPMRKDPFGQ